MAEQNGPLAINRILTKVIPHDKQRYPTVGDWKFAGRDLHVLVSDLGDYRYESCVAVHETIEALLCLRDGIAEEDVSAFDIAYEDARDKGIAAPCGCVPTEESEPGEDVHAPYREQHAFADGVERLLANQLGVAWDEYSRAVAALG